MSFRCLCLLLVVVTVAEAYSQFANPQSRPQITKKCDDSSWALAESIPVGINLTTSKRTHEAWVDIINSASNYIHIAALYCTLSGGQAYNRTEGTQVFNAIVAALKRGVSVKLAISGGFPEKGDEGLLEQYGAVVGYVNVSQLLGSGVLHTKVIIVDGVDHYVGSANFDWRSLIEIKEMGVVVKDCPLVTADIDKIFDTYWILSNATNIPLSYPVYVQTVYNQDNPMIVPIAEETSSVYLVSSPQEANPKGRGWDLDSFKSTILNSKTVCAEVMDYEPLIVFEPHKQYFPDLDTAFREAAVVNKVNVKFLISKWPHTSYTQRQFLDSLNAIYGIEVRFMFFPQASSPIPYTRVNHAKFLVTDNTSLITTSNWEGDYFLTTMGITQISNSSFLVSQLQSRFDRDWSSQYAHPMSDWDKYN